MANHYPIPAESLSNALLISNQCSSRQESDAIADSILVDFKNNESTLDKESRRNALVGILQDYLDLAPDEASGILQHAGMKDNLDDISSSSSNDSHEETTQQEAPDNGVDDDIDDGELIGEGECELCERQMRLTRHHLIPKSTHSRIEPKLVRAATAMNKGDLERAERILGHGLEHFASDLDMEKSSIRRILEQTCDICRPCHSAIHKTHDNMTLALEYNTVDQLLQDEQIYKFCKWASKQKPGKYAMNR
eukprot:CAMPEP_0202503936 /NCGR_PEP_ID=MMETSP1361-20130828/43218_1 /ASSEMBLY_ACC=CAM_ASM_000849 /TAXON_ID=210615 /ORGANISM="Staurosira complex sp., Strain CCMP2646" /LENGTH=249 /DNA_ID=CAMNT_0049137317 /DNA_START=42 /DNA_END=791 /DNA_ORIENTATION=+